VLLSLINFREIQDRSTTFCQEILHRISRKYCEWFIR